MNKKSRVRFCWDCSKKLMGDHWVEKIIEGFPRILHKDCSKEYKGEIIDISPKNQKVVNRL